MNFKEVARFFLARQSKKSKFLGEVDYNTDVEVLKEMLLRFCIDLLKFSNKDKFVNIHLYKYRCYLFDISSNGKMYLLHFVSFENEDYSFAVLLKEAVDGYSFDYIERYR